MLIDLFVIFGGQNPEHDVSILSAVNVINAANRSRYKVYAVYIEHNGRWRVLNIDHELNTDELKSRLALIASYPAAEILYQYIGKDNTKVVFPLIHGRYGEDGTLQGMLEFLGIPCVGCGVMGSALGMDKAFMKRMARALGIPTAGHITLGVSEYLQDENDLLISVEQQIHYPCFVKPARGGSSIGIARADNRLELKQAVQNAFCFDDKILAEEAVDGREIEIGLLGNNQISCSLPGEFVRYPSFFDYKSKYHDDNLTMRIPADITDDVYREMCRYALAIYRECDCSGLCRADFFLTETGRVLFNEINTIPGFTEFSMYPSLWDKTANINTGQLVDKLVYLALEKYSTINRFRIAGEKI